MNETTNPQDAPPPQSISLGGLLLIILLLGCIGGLVFAFGYYFSLSEIRLPSQEETSRPTPPSMGDTQGIESQLGKIERQLETQQKIMEGLLERIELLETPSNEVAPDAPPAEVPMEPTAPPPVAVPSPPPAAPAPKTDRLESQLESMQAKMDALQETIVQEQQKTNRFVRLSRLYDELEAASATHQPFGAALNGLLAELDKGSAAYGIASKLKPAAEQGLASADSLQQSLQQVIEKLYRSEEFAEDGWNGLRQSLASVITVRKVGEAHEGSDVQSIIARTEAAAERGEWQSGLMEIEQLPPAQRAYFNEWSKQLQTKLEAEALLKSLQRSLMDAPTAPPSPAAAPEAPPAPTAEPPAP